jgi:hypothetical protein
MRGDQEDEEGQRVRNDVHVATGLCTFNDVSPTSVTVEFLSESMPQDLFTVRLQYDDTDRRNLIVVSSDIIGASRWTTHEQSANTVTLENFEELVPLRTGCSCTNLSMEIISDANARYLPNPTAFVDAYNKRRAPGKCDTWDLMYADQCRAHPSLDYCNELWCYVDASTCPGAMPSTYFDLSVHFSYEACKNQKVSNSWTKSHPRNCIMMDVPIGSINVVGEGVCRMDGRGIVTVDVDRSNVSEMVLFSNNIWDVPTPSTGRTHDSSTAAAFPRNVTNTIKEELVHSTLQPNQSYLLQVLQGSYAVVSSNGGDLILMTIDQINDLHMTGMAHFTNRPHFIGAMNRSHAHVGGERCTFLVNHYEAISNPRTRRLFVSWDGSLRYRGNWCGPGWANGAWISEYDQIEPTVGPEDCCDGACMAHDMCISDSFQDCNIERMNWCNAEMANKMYNCWRNLPWYKKWDKWAGCGYMQFVFSILRSPTWCGGKRCSNVPC